MFDIPPQALRTAESDGCANQSFMHSKAVCLQFHLESSMFIDHLIKNCCDEQDDEKFMERPSRLTMRPFEAIQCFDNTTEIDSLDAAAWYNKGVALNKLGCTAESDAAFAKAKELGYTG